MLSMLVLRKQNAVIAFARSVFFIRGRLCQRKVVVNAISGTKYLLTSKHRTTNGATWVPLRRCAKGAWIAPILIRSAYGLVQLRRFALALPRPPASLLPVVTIHPLLRGTHAARRAGAAKGLSVWPTGRRVHIFPAVRGCVVKSERTPTRQGKCWGEIAETTEEKKT